MESVLSQVGVVFCQKPRFGETKNGFLGTNFNNTCSFGRRVRSVVVVKAEAGGVSSINPDVRKNEEKVVDSVVLNEVSKPVTAYCRCWRSGTFPLCDGSHVKHNKATGDNVGPLLLKK
ncbi:unnamed protein product [Vicia faba]|uniref:Iron-binding zinc finger CDGSH type domain-containing protein n=1 Tax=Vicia faba TaxID=3906 RepID=A0AAV0Z4Q7_VICFA|nr:unnamed protein product [Vicia faba]